VNKVIVKMVLFYFIAWLFTLVSTRGHAWTAYQREIDNEWIVLDWCYGTTDSPLAEREPMSEDLKYIDDYFFVQATKTVETPYANRVRFATISPSFFLNTIA
jgi:hypothetical protein